MRGALGQFGYGHAPKWIIPADAGSTGRELVRHKVPADHPRGCGEHPSSSACPTTRWESSPRMRGALIHLPDKNALAGIIPADAGSTKVCGYACLHSGDHPRGCGEHYDNQEDKTNA